MKNFAGSNWKPANGIKTAVVLQNAASHLPYLWVLVTPAPFSTGK
jgi:hypothetical protein